MSALILRLNRRASKACGRVGATMGRRAPVWVPVRAAGKAAQARCRRKLAMEAPVVVDWQTGMQWAHMLLADFFGIRIPVLGEKQSVNVALLNDQRIMLIDQLTLDFGVNAQKAFYHISGWVMQAGACGFTPHLILSHLLVPELHRLRAEYAQK